MNPKSAIRNPNSRGVSIIAAIFIIVILAFMGVMFVSLISTGSFSAINDMQSAQALYIAEGGLQYTLGLNKNNMPNYSTHGAWINLGAGQFRVDTPTYVTVPFTANLATLTVDSTAGFPATGRLTIGTDFNITYNGITPNSFLNVLPIPHEAHIVNDSVYPAARLSSVISAASCADLPTIDVLGNDTGGFDIRLPFFIDTEYFLCAAKTQYQFQNCKRCFMGSSKAAHNTNSYASQYILTSTGRVAGVSGNAERIIQITAGPYEL